MLPVITEFDDRTEYVWPLASGDRTVCVNYKVAAGFRCAEDISPEHQQPDMAFQVDCIKRCSEQGKWEERDGYARVQFDAETNPDIPVPASFCIQAQGARMLIDIDFDVTRAKGKSYDYLHAFYSAMER